MKSKHSSEFGGGRIALGAMLCAAIVLSGNRSANAQCGGEWILRSPAARPSARFGSAMAYDAARGVVVLFGGGVPGADAETWEWDGTNWSKKLPANSPSPRYYHAMAYDMVRGVTVLFGGSNAGVPLGETWTWDGANWTQVTPATTPAARFGSAMVFDTVRNTILLFGGDTGLQSNETWEWDGTNWTMKTPLTSPPARSYHAMAFDSLHGIAVLFSGYTGSGFFTDTWEWNGTDWSQRSPATSPTGREFDTLAFDSARGVAVLFGGFNGVSILADTHEWNGTDWAARLPVVSPAGRFSQAMAYDSSRRVVVLFGGSISGAGMSQETWEWASPGPAIIAQPTDKSVAAGSSVDFSMSAIGGTVTFRWRRNGALLMDGDAFSGTGTATLTVNPVDSTTIGSFDCRVANSCGETFSRIAVLSSPPMEMAPAAAGAACGLCGSGMSVVMMSGLVAWLIARRRQGRPRI